MKPIDFESDANEVLINPRMPSETGARLRARLSVAAHLRAHVFVLTSGSTASSNAQWKWVALAKSAVLASADGANVHLNASTGDVWLLGLPDFHVAGLGILARAWRSGSKVYRTADERWDPASFANTATQVGATLASLVPTQVFDLVEAGVRSPETLRAIIVGGAALDGDVYVRARALGWPVLPSYGMTEAASQIATASLNSLDGAAFPRLRVLSHLEAGVDSEGRLRVRGKSLLTGYIRLGATGQPEFHDPKDANGWLTTEDFGDLTLDGLTITGRERDRVKVGGELVNLAALRERLELEAARLGVAHNVALVVTPDSRLESVIALVAEESVSGATIAELQAKFSAAVLPFERIRVVCRVDRIPRTELGKVKWTELAALARER